MLKLSKTKLSDTSLKVGTDSQLVYIDSVIPLDIKELKLNQGLKSEQTFEGLALIGYKRCPSNIDLTKTLFDELYD
jgi:hypothetical protein